MIDLLGLALLLTGIALAALLVPVVVAIGFGIAAAGVLVAAFVWWRDSKRKAPGEP